ncbi:uncharacterized protein PG998_005476 [Apiospora kogelbergensis]|uniref:Uncharacterized protein n=1 Tax=Apiospora kogelbergensis TaxID=1337665 RepID=A0AAW0QGV6_9PEZI
MQFSFNAIFAALAMASVASAQNGLCISREEFGACSGQYPQACEAISGTGVRFFSCCLASVNCS